MLCEVGAWKNYEELEENLTLDELFLTYEKVSDRQERLIKTIGSALGGSFEDTKTESEPSPGGVHLDQGPMMNRPDKDQNIGYAGGDIKLGDTTAFGYKRVEKID